MRRLLGTGFTLGVAAAIVAAESTSHWAFQPVTPADPPPVRASEWVKTPVDRFILAQLETAGIEPAGAASREQLIRRVSLGLTGLPPTPEEIDAFVSSPAADAYEALIDRLLGSPHYGERWARHWLDLARYAESDGFEHDAVRPQTWRYRDYVVDAFNADKPYDRFVQEQIAGDELWPDRPEALVATGFNLLGPDMVDSADQMQRRLNTLNDMTDTLAGAVLGLTLGCARCHDHKSEPFTQRDYFSLQAFFTPARLEREHAIPTESERLEHETAMKAYNERTSGPREAVVALEAPYREKLYEGHLAKLSEDAQAAHRTPKVERTEQQEATVQETSGQVRVTYDEVTKAMSAEDKKRRKELLDQIKNIPKPESLPTAMALKSPARSAAKTFVLARGDYNNPGEEVKPAFPAVLTEQGPSTGGRAALARWLTSAAQPLTARVMANRIWQHHFGRGLVITPSDFGTRGSAPTHPELLDWLADEFVRGGWSIKRMHKLILLSSTYQQSSEPEARTRERDPDNRLFSRQNRVRLEGEAVRDGLLAISGRLNPRMGGPSVWPPIPEEITQTSKNWTASVDPADHTRRSIYVFARRNIRYPFLEVFDAPDSNLSCAERGASTTAPQSLTLLNSESVMIAARATAQRVLNAASDRNERLEFAYRLILGRKPTSAEAELSRQFLAETQERLGEGDVRASWTELCRALFNLNAFVYVD